MEQQGGIKRKTDSDDYCESYSSSEKKKGPRAPWTSQDMISAMLLVKQGMSITKAALSLNIPRTTLRDRVTGKVKNVIKLGPHAALSGHDERSLVNYCKLMRKQGYGKTKEMILFMAGKLTQKNGSCFSETFPNDNWWKAFCARHNQPLMFETDEVFGSPKHQVNEAILNNCYQHLLDVLTSNKYDMNFLEHPELIYSCNENLFSLHQVNTMMKCHQRNKRKTETHPNGEELNASQTASHADACDPTEDGSAARNCNTGSCSVISCVNALGHSLQPMFIHSNCNLDNKFNLLLEKQALSRLDQDFFLEWFREVFLHNIPRSGPSVLLYDGNNCLVTKDVLMAATMADVILFCIPASLTHVLQPLDLSINGMFHDSWKSFLAQGFDDVENVLHSNFSQIFLAAWKAMLPSSLIAERFKAVGVYPFFRQNCTMLGLAETSEADNQRKDKPKESEQNASHQHMNQKDFLTQGVDSSGNYDSFENGTGSYDTNQNYARHARVITRPTMSNLNKPLSAPVVAQVIADEDEYRNEFLDIYHESNSTDGVLSSSDEGNTSAAPANTGASVASQSKLSMENKPMLSLLPAAIADQRKPNKPVNSQSNPVKQITLPRSLQMLPGTPPSFVSNLTSTPTSMTSGFPKSKQGSKNKKKTNVQSNHRTIDLSSTPLIPEHAVRHFNSQSHPSEDTHSRPQILASLNALEELLGQRRLGKFQSADSNRLQKSVDSDPLYPVWRSLKRGHLRGDNLTGADHVASHVTGNATLGRCKEAQQPTGTVINVDKSPSQSRATCSHTDDDYHTIVTPAGNVSVNRNATVIVIMPAKPEESHSDAAAPEVTVHTRPQTSNEPS